MNSRPFQQRHWVRSICCLLICVSSWKGPVPMIHHHAMPDFSADHRQAHLHVFHSEAIADECWHWHIVIPHATGEDNGGSRRSADIDGHLLMPPSADSQNCIAVSELRGEFSNFSRLHQSEVDAGTSVCRSASVFLNATSSSLNRMLSRTCLCSVTGVALI